MAGQAVFFPKADKVIEIGHGVVEVGPGTPAGHSVVGVGDRAGVGAGQILHEVGGVTVADRKMVDGRVISGGSHQSVIAFHRQLREG